MKKQTANPLGVSPGTRVLCVDDESMIGELVTRILRSQFRCEVETARNGIEALDILSEQTFDIIVIDFVMPEMDGGQLYQELKRSRPELLHRVMFITGDILSPTTLDYIAGTGRLLLEKPFGLPELTRAIGEMGKQCRRGAALPET